MSYNNFEINDLSYDKAIELDKRTYLQYYISLIMTKHLLIFSFIYNDDYNSRLIKINLFFFTFGINYTVNGLFFNDSSMHKLYVDEGKYNFIYQIPKIIYSTIISSVVLTILKFLALSEKNVLKIKRAEKDVLDKVYKMQTKFIKLKFILFFIIIIIFLFLFWYYIGCFCAVYENTQIHLLSDSLISFAISLFYPLVIYLIPGIFRLCSLNNKEKDRKRLYNFSKIIQLII